MNTAPVLFCMIFQNNTKTQTMVLNGTLIANFDLTKCEYDPKMLKFKQKNWGYILKIINEIGIEDDK